LNPIVSVIIPTYNRGSSIGAAIQSVLSQTFSSFEILVIDDGSTDNTPSIVASFADPRIIYEKHPNSGGPARPRNRGVQISQAKWIAFLDSDDWWMPNKLQESVDMLEAGADFVYHESYLVSSLPPKRHYWKRSKARKLKSPVFYDLLLNGPAMDNSSVVVKRELLDLIGGFSEDPLLIAAEDYDAWLRLAKHTEAFGRLNKPLGYYWCGGGGINSAKRSICYLERLAALHLDEGTGKSAFSCSPFFSYVMGKANCALGQFDVAKVLFKDTMSKARFSRLFFSALWRYLALKCKK
jgi:glycosyltransferase involved in cell wall biosynthesis